VIGLTSYRVAISFTAHAHILHAARVLDGAALIMRAVAEGGAAAAGPLREAALAEGAMLHHLLVAVTAQVMHSHSCSMLY